MTATPLSPRALMSLLANGVKAMDVLETALDLGLLDALERGPVRLGQLSVRFDLRPDRLYKLLDCLESLGFVHRDERTDDINDAEYRAVPGLQDAAVAVVGPDAIERDRDKYPWRHLHGRLADTLRGRLSITEDDFAWPPKTAAQIAGFEQSMAAGLGPIIEAFRTHAPRLWPDRHRLLDVGGGDGTLATHLLTDTPGLTIDVYNLPAVQPLVDETRARSGHGPRLGFVGGDFLTEPLPTGYDAMAFVRVLHDWPAGTAHRLIEQAYHALPARGRLLICEEFRTSERLAMQFFWSYFLIGVDSCASRLREITFYTSALRRAGFHEIEVLPGPFELISARKP
ncbi:methyltransferase [Micromonospora sp. DR5-3]|uniref:methyltransferase n=1 Tax=unclassified Micromonospora TaxID=2617518 RepID=UPI0011D77517|nr:MULTISPECIES: methyltransferase [unclassified Micromonospora]MCW3814357.1 methyltransferase [Micromonospora sp. DR5-3]TYC22448.1 ArsR family transcriptional regulator [Micromonospora sp. MP36]